MSLRGPEVLQAAIHFPEGLVGCPDWQHFVQIVDDQEDQPVAILQCLDDARIQLLVTNPDLIVPGYRAQVESCAHAELGIPADNRLLVYCTLTVNTTGSISANLLGPLVIDPAERRGQQLVLAESGYSTRYPVAYLPPTEPGA